MTGKHFNSYIPGEFEIVGGSEILSFALLVSFDALFVRDGMSLHLPVALKLVV